MQSTDKKENTPKRIALVTGATGLTGKYLLRMLYQTKKYSKIIVFTRKPLDIIFENLEEIIVDFDELPNNVFANDIYCCLGTTIKNAGTKEAFRKVDYEYVVNLANKMKDAGAENFAVISAMGASKKSLFFYSRVKGEMEETVSKIGFNATYIFRPSLIAGTRKEKRNGEKLAIQIFAAVNPLLIGPLAKYQSVSPQAIAKAMIVKMIESEKGFHIIKSDEIKNIF